MYLQHRQHAWVYVVMAVMAGCFAAVVSSWPLVGVAIFAVFVFIIVAIKTTVGSALVAGCLLALSLSGLISRYVGSLGFVNQAAVAILIAVGLLYLRQVVVPKLVSVSVVAFVVLSSFFAAAAWFKSPSLAIASWIALVAPVFVVAAVSGVASAPVKDSIRRVRGTRLLVATVLCGVVVNIGFGLKQALIGFSYREVIAAADSQSTSAVGEDLRIMGAMPTNQDYGLYIAGVAPALLMLAVYSSGRRRVAYFVFTFGAYSCVLLSLTRTAVVASVVAALIGLIIFSGRFRALRIYQLCVFVLIFIFSFQLVALRISNERWLSAMERIQTFSDLTTDRSYNDRLSDTLPVAVQTFLDNWWGGGAGSAGPISQKYAYLVPFGELTPDNGYLIIGIQLGLVGLITFVLMLFGLVRWLGTRVDGGSKAAQVTVLSLCVAMLLAGYWSLNAPMSVVAAIVGLGIARPDFGSRTSTVVKCVSSSV